VIDVPRVESPEHTWGEGQFDACRRDRRDDCPTAVQDEVEHTRTRTSTTEGVEFKLDDGIISESDVSIFDPAIQIFRPSQYLWRSRSGEV
jgi:hypothetical protein